MATALAEHARDRIANGLVIAPEGQAAAVPGMSVRETAHPTPDLRCERAAREALGLERAMPVVLDSAWIPMPELDA